MEESTKTRITKLLTSKKTFLFMKGTPQFPQCGFSARAIAILKEMEVDFETFIATNNNNKINRLNGIVLCRVLPFIVLFYTQVSHQCPIGQFNKHERKALIYLSLQH